MSLNEETTTGLMSKEEVFFRIVKEIPGLEPTLVRMINGNPFTNLYTSINGKEMKIMKNYEQKNLGLCEEIFAYASDVDMGVVTGYAKSVIPLHPRVVAREAKRVFKAEELEKFIKLCVEANRGPESSFKKENEYLASVIFAKYVWLANHLASEQVELNVREQNKAMSVFYATSRCYKKTLEMLAFAGVVGQSLDDENCNVEVTKRVKGISGKRTCESARESMKKLKVSDDDSEEEEEKSCKSDDNSEDERERERTRLRYELQKIARWRSKNGVMAKVAKLVEDERKKVETKEKKVENEEVCGKKVEEEEIIVIEKEAEKEMGNENETKAEMTGIEFREIEGDSGSESEDEEEVERHLIGVSKRQLQEDIDLYGNYSPEERKTIEEGEDQEWV